MNEQEMKDRFEELAPWHANGTLEGPDKAWVDEYISTHADARAELEWYRALRRELTAEMPDVAPDLGWDKLSARIRSEKRATRRSFGEQLRDFVGGLLGAGREGSSLALRPALAYAAVAVVVVQAGVIGSLLLQQGKQEADLAQWRALSAPAVSGPVLRVSFKPEATEQDMRMLLLKINGTFVGGPGQLGGYIVYVPAERVAAAESTLRGDPRVEAVDVLPTLPAKE